MAERTAIADVERTHHTPSHSPVSAFCFCKGGAKAGGDDDDSAVDSAWAATRPSAGAQSVERK